MSKVRTYFVAFTLQSDEGTFLGQKVVPSVLTGRELVEKVTHDIEENTGIKYLNGKVILTAFNEIPSE